MASLRKFPQETQKLSTEVRPVLVGARELGRVSFRPRAGGWRSPRKSAKAVRFDCADKWYEYFSIQDLLSTRVLMALDMAGKPLPDRHGAPLRLIDPSRYGYKSAKLITSIDFRRRGARAAWPAILGPIIRRRERSSRAMTIRSILGGPKRKISGGEITEY